MPPPITTTRAWVGSCVGPATSGGGTFDIQSE
jgi:hypothetical protein